MSEQYPIKTYSEDIDKIIGGFYPGEVTLICSVNGFGDESSEFIFSLLKMITYGSGVPGVLFSYDKLVKNIYSRIIGSIAGVCWCDICDSKINENDKVLVSCISKQVYDLPLEIKWTPELCVQQLCDEIRLCCIDKGSEIVYLDGLWLIGIDNNQTWGFEKDCFVIQKLKELAQELNIPIIVTYNRNGKHLINDKELSVIVNASDTIIGFDKIQYNSTMRYHQLPLSVYKTHDGNLGTFYYWTFFDMSILYLIPDLTT